MLFFLLACLSDYDIKEVEQDRAGDASERLLQENVAFINYCGTIINPGSAFEDNPTKMIGRIYERPFECRQGSQSIVDCAFRPGFSNLRPDNLTIDYEEVEEVVFNMNISYEDGMVTGLFDTLDLLISDGSMVNMIATEVFKTSLVENEALDRELERFLTDFSDPEQEQAYVYDVSVKSVVTREYYYYGLEPDGAGEQQLIYFGDGYYFDSGLFNTVQVFHVCIQPFIAN